MSSVPFPLCKVLNELAGGAPKFTGALLQSLEAFQASVEEKTKKTKAAAAPKKKENSIQQILGQSQAKIEKEEAREKTVAMARALIKSKKKNLEPTTFLPDSCFRQFESL